MVWWILAACRPDPVPLERATVQAVSEQGLATIQFEVEHGTHALLNVQTDGWMALDALEGPEGRVLFWEDWVDDEQLTLAIYASPSQLTLNWPIREQDPPLIPGTWSAILTVVDEAFDPLDGTAVSGVVLQKRDEQLDRGTLRALVVVATDLDPSLQDGVDGALSRWKSVFGRAGIDLEFDIRFEAVSVEVPLPYAGDPAITAVAELADDHGLIVWVGESILDESGVFGSAGNIPNAPVAGPRSVLAVGALAAAGPDGVFDNEEIRLFGEAMAHEAGHYAGLFHPVETDWSHFDALEDTRLCSDQASCEEAFPQHLMFPFPQCSAGSCVTMDRVSEDQKAVLQRNVGVR